MATTFEGYQPLASFRKQIRVMIIHPYQVLETEIVACTLEKTDLVDANPFHALSYVWGPETLVSPLLVNGRTVLIRRSLWLFLHTLRARFCSRSSGGPLTTIRVWADYICVNQSDDQERNHQVSMMGEIYEAADSVYSWLGESAEALDDGMQCIAEAVAMRANNLPWYMLCRDLGRIDVRLYSIATSQYWNRMWIKQEAMLAKDLWLFYGSSVAHWKDTLFVAKMLRQTDSQGRTSGQLPAWTKAMLTTLQPRETQRFDEQLSELVVRYADAKCQDARDRIYALLSLIDRSTKEQIVVDYKKSVLQVLLENYSHWTKDTTRSARASRSSGRPDDCVFQHGQFCTNMKKMLSDSEIENLCLSEDDSRPVEASGLFWAGSVSSITRMQVIAYVSDEDVFPREGSLKSVNQDHTFVLRLEVRTRGSKHSMRPRSCFVYSYHIPEVDHLVAWIGHRVLFLVQETSTLSDHGRLRPAVSIIGTGTEMVDTTNSRSNHLLRTLRLAHPGTWKRQQLAGAQFISLPDHERRLSADIKVLCNAAAIVTLLRESRRSRITTELERPPVDTLQSSLWAPYVFGIQHKVLNPCSICRTNRMSPLVAREPAQDRCFELEECTCRWGMW
ncbi:unnamed protein product [Zymoseptoria tritici ST99CH_1A5]|uniref:Heterokaryon incompatibility domain-containing protein n=3 Tax=Zymoseptoria tritici TaxID=1047171 RepID=A0A2H1FX71_ZYMTR|nr:unnamed protein product [Zymoseptoria tritici ST99CH_1E4]SMY21052.1 unnamed protein product [Zymoseptoria tritici ST99CH_1A5]